MSSLQILRNDPGRWLALNVWWLRWPVAVLVLLGVAGAAFYLRGDTALLLLAVLMLMPILLIGSYLLPKYLALGFVILMPANMVVPFAIGTGSETSLHITILLIMAMTGLWLFDMINHQRRIWLLKSKPILPLLLLLVSAFVSFLVGLLPWFVVEGASLPAQIGGLAVFVISACAFLLAAHHIHDIRWLQWITWSFVAIGATFIIVRLVPQLWREAGRVYSFGSFSSQFFTWLAVITFSQAWLNRKLPRLSRLVLATICLGTLYVVTVKTFDWKSGWIPPLIGIGATMAIYSSRIALAMGIGGAFALPVALSQLIATDEYSYGTRVDAWAILGEIIKVNPILGLGPSNYYWYTPLYAIRGYNVEFNSHNQYIDLLAQVGIVGTVLVIWFFAAVAVVGWRLKDRVPDGFAKAYVYGALGGLVATVASGMLGDWFLPFVYNVGVAGMRSSILGWIFLGALVAMERIYMPADGEALPASTQPTS